MTQSITVLYDGRCGLCQRSVATLKKLDWFRRLLYVDYWNEKQKNTIAPDLSLQDLDYAMHVVIEKGLPRSHGAQRRVLRGFDGFRAIAWHLPLLWPIIPFLYIPPIPQIGGWIYAHIAEQRQHCAHEQCNR